MFYMFLGVENIDYACQRGLASASRLSSAYSGPDTTHVTYTGFLLVDLIFSVCATTIEICFVGPLEISGPLPGKQIR